MLSVISSQGELCNTKSYYIILFTRENNGLEWDNGHGDSGKYKAGIRGSSSARCAAINHRDSPSAPCPDTTTLLLFHPGEEISGPAHWLDSPVGSALGIKAVRHRVRAQGVGSPLPPPLTSRGPSPQVPEAGATEGRGGERRGKRRRGVKGFVFASGRPSAVGSHPPPPATFLSSQRRWGGGDRIGGSDQGACATPGPAHPSIPSNRQPPPLLTTTRYAYPVTRNPGCNQEKLPSESLSKPEQTWLDRPLTRLGAAAPVFCGPRPGEDQSFVLGDSCLSCFSTNAHAPLSHNEPLRPTTDLGICCRGWKGPTGEA
ncbi:uncharacterized protein [Gorilla gorilla gorilla]|uniref:uncharacterized protein n=1 Tax=Gorilla gorilla gorilla TaxID=9595 RepID=UPI0030087B79